MNMPGQALCPFNKDSRRSLPAYWPWFAWISTFAISLKFGALGISQHTCTSHMYSRKFFSFHHFQYHLIIRYLETANLHLHGCHILQTSYPAVQFPSHYSNFPSKIIQKAVDIQHTFQNMYIAKHRTKEAEHSR